MVEVEHDTVELPLFFFEKFEATVTYKEFVNQSSFLLVTSQPEHKRLSRGCSMFTTLQTLNTA